MATINGITIKSFKTFSGIEYPTIREAVIWKDGKKIGTFREDEWGGENHMTSGLAEAVKPSALQYQSGCKDNWRKEFEGQSDSLIEHILDLAEYEKIYKQNCKNGFPYTLILGNNWKYIAYRLTKRFSLKDKENRPQFLKNDINKEFPKKDHWLKMFSSPDDFVITVDKDNPVPKCLAKG